MRRWPIQGGFRKDYWTTVKPQKPSSGWEDNNKSVIVGLNIDYAQRKVETDFPGHHIIRMRIVCPLAVYTTLHGIRPMAERRSLSIMQFASLSIVWHTSLEYLSNQALCCLRAVQQRLHMPALSGGSITHRPLQMYSATWPTLIDPKLWFAAASDLPCEG